MASEEGGAEEKGGRDEDKELMSGKVFPSKLQEVFGSRTTIADLVITHTHACAHTQVNKQAHSHELTFFDLLTHTMVQRTPI